jgi:hypothetical protein
VIRRRVRGAVVAAVAAFSVTGEQARASDGFVTAHGTWLNGRPWRFTGLNYYNAPTAGTTAAPRRAAGP